MLTSTIVLMLTIIPISIIAYKKPLLPVAIVGISTLAFLVVVGWIPIFLFAVIILFIALGAGLKFKDVIG